MKDDDDSLDLNDNQFYLARRAHYRLRAETGISYFDIQVFAYIDSWMASTGKCYASNVKIGRFFDAHEKQVSRTITRLRKVKLLKSWCEKGKRRLATKWPENYPKPSEVPIPCGYRVDDDET